MTHDELLARARLLSAARVARHGSPPADATVWWQQVEALAAELDMPITWAEWHSVSVSRETAQRQEDLL
jgi:hypothetical protein